jgi:sigma-E factor negative regulatory protein RseB
MFSYFFLLIVSLPALAVYGAGQNNSALTEIDSAAPSLAKTDELIVDSLSSLFQVLSLANKSISYSSLLTYEANGYITTFKLRHQIHDDIAYEQLMFLDGPQRMVMRQQGLSNCTKGPTRWGLWPTAIAESALSTYSLKAQGFERIANRKAIIFDVLPKDDLRYGYRYSVDTETGLVLKVITYYKTTIIERLQVVSLELLPPDDRVVIDNYSDYLWRVPETEPCTTEQFQVAWKVDWLPEGFVAVGNRLTAQGEQVLMFADGLVSLSVFIVNDHLDYVDKTTARHGATVVVISPIATGVGRSVAVVGEVPTATARRIAVSVKSK